MDTKHSPKLAFQPTPSDDDIQAEIYDERTAVVVCAVYKASEVSPALIVSAVNSHADHERKALQQATVITGLRDQLDARSREHAELVAVLARLDSAVHSDVPDHPIHDKESDLYAALADARALLSKES